MKSLPTAAVGAIGLVIVLWAAPEDLLQISGLSGRRGGRLIYTQRTEPRTLNPVIAVDAASREVINRLFADLIHINRYTQKTELALAKSWTVSRDGLQFQVELRRGIRFSDGRRFDADDVVFTFQVMLDENVNAPQRSLLILNGKPIRIRKLDAYRVQFDLPAPYAAANGYSTASLSCPGISWSSLSGKANWRKPGGWVHRHRDRRAGSFAS